MTMTKYWHVYDPRHPDLLRTFLVNNTDPMRLTYWARQGPTGVYLVKVQEYVDATGPEPGALKCTSLRQIAEHHISPGDRVIVKRGLPRHFPRSHQDHAITYTGANAAQVVVAAAEVLERVTGSINRPPSITGAVLPDGTLFLYNRGRRLRTKIRLGATVIFTATKVVVRPPQES